MNSQQKDSNIYFSLMAKRNVPGSWMFIYKYHICIDRLVNDYTKTKF